MKTLYVCGDSFSAPSSIPEYKGTSYAEVLAKKLDWKLIHLARQGCSNGGIRIQIQEAIKNKANFVIVGPTSYDRMEIPAAATPYHWQSKNRSWGNDLQDHLTTFSSGYDPAAGIDNINYGTNSYRLICETIFSLAENLPHPYRRGQIDKDTQTAIKYYVNCLYDSNWKAQVDDWLIIEGMFEMFHQSIPFSIDPNLLWQACNIRERIPSAIPDVYLRLNKQETIGHAIDLYPLDNFADDPGYHGKPESQEYIANFYYDFITNTWSL